MFYIGQADSDGDDWVGGHAVAQCPPGSGRHHRLDDRLADGDWFGDEPRVFRLGFGFPPLADLKVALDALRKAVRAAD